MDTKPQKEHEWLQKLVGDWTFEGEWISGPGQPNLPMKGTESARAMSGLWFIADAVHEMPAGGEMLTIVALGYDTLRKRYVGSFIGSMMTFLWVYDGELDASGNVLTLNTEGPDMNTEGKMSPYRDVITIISNDERTLTSEVQGDDGKWTQIMLTRYRRSK